jgi:hypothetical protein
VFHALIASTMGLNTFFFAWVATYPAVAWVAFHARASLLF